MPDLLDDLTIFEMANNHQGSVEHGLAIVAACAQVARAHDVHAGVKLQLRDLDSFIHADWRGRDDVPHIPRFEATRLELDDFGRLVEATREAGLVPVATPFDEVSVGACVDLGVDVLKVASCSACDWPLLETIAAAQLPVVASTGGLGIFEIDNLVSFFRKRAPSFALMHCVSLYPTPNEKVALGFMEKMIRRYPYITVGYSGHEAPDNTEVVVAAIAKGARLLERHVGIPTEHAPLNAYSLCPEQAERWVMAAKRSRSISGSDRSKQVDDEELSSLRSLQRGVFAKKPLRRGQGIERPDVFFAMPCQAGQLSSGDFGHLRARFSATRDYNAGEAVFEVPVQDQISQLRGIAHDARGQIFEAGIVLGDDCPIEISHHYGLDHFREATRSIITAARRRPSAVSGAMRS